MFGSSGVKLELFLLFQCNVNVRLVVLIISSNVNITLGLVCKKQLCSNVNK